MTKHKGTDFLGIGMFLADIIIIALLIGEWINVEDGYTIAITIASAIAIGLSLVFLFKMHK